MIINLIKNKLFNGDNISHEKKLIRAKFKEERRVANLTKNERSVARRKFLCYNTESLKKVIEMPELNGTKCKKLAKTELVRREEFKFSGLDNLMTSIIINFMLVAISFMVGCIVFESIFASIVSSLISSIVCIRSFWRSTL